VLGPALLRRTILACAACVAFGFGASSSGADPGPLVSLEVAPAHFSPNGDRRKDASTLTVSVSQPAAVDVRALDRAGNVVRVLADDYPVERAIGIVWDGLTADGRRAADGIYQFVVEARDQVGQVTSAAARVRVDTDSPRLAWRSRGGSVGAAALTVRFRLRDASAPLSGRFRVLSAYGRAVRPPVRRRLAAATGSITLTRRAILALAPGVYRVQAVINDAAGNRSAATLSPAYRFDRGVRTRVVARVQNAGRHVALTFDDCASASSWASILATLARAQVKGAFFCPGNIVRTSPGLAARTVRAGHTIGAHGWDHALLTAAGYGGSLWRLRREWDVWWRWRQAATPYFRPPYGAYNSSVLAAAGDAGYRYTVVWDIDTRDWTTPGVGAIVSRSVRPTRSGSIILLHVKPQTAHALPGIIRGLRARGLRPIGLDELLHRRGASASPGGWSARLGGRE
jgi:peptidoglycan/xylan/chitin deacetylase (PgdA/CDA1 family)